MGIVIKQGIYNSIFTYLGFLIGGIYTVFLVPVVFQTSPEHWGLTRYLVSFAMVIVPWVQLSIPFVIIRYFPIFKQKQKKDFMFFILFWTSFGIIFSTLLVFIFLKLWYTDKNALLMDNLFLVFPIFIGFVLFEIASSISKSYFKTIVPVFLKELFLRLNVMIIILLYWYEVIDFNLFIKLFAFNYLFNILLLLIYLLHLKALNFSINFKIIFNKDFIPIYTYVAFSILAAGTAMVLLNIDTLMINHYLTLKQVAIYGPSIYVAGSILIPSRALQSIITPLVADGWATNNLKLIKELYIKSAIVPLIFTIFMFLLIWLNIDLLMSYFGETFGKGKYIILFLSVGYIINITTGINGTIINTSKHYRVELFFQIGLVIATVIMNIIFIPKYGINGAALATAITISVYNSLKSVYVRYKFGMHPFSYKTLIVLATGALLFGLITILPEISKLMNFILLSGLLSVVYWLVIYFTKSSEDINGQINNILLKVFKK